MKRFLPYIIGLAAFAPAAALAVTDAEVQYRAMGMASGFFGVMAFVMLTVVASVVGFLVFWVLMLLDCLQREWPEKAAWTAILILSLFMSLHWLSAILYYVLVLQKNPGTMPVSAPKKKR
jgi:D-alanyl-lipoteichoic acid acyltransferase DltB (MBOAT superfamily)